MPLDQITKTLVQQFLSDTQLRSQGEPTDFEFFVTNVVVSPQIDGAVDYANVMTGNGGDTGLDAIAIIVNGQLITDPDEVDSLARHGATLDVNYVFVQTEISTHFSTDKIGQIVFGVKDFFSLNPSLQRNDAVQLAAKVSSAIISNARLFRGGNPTCTVYYATAGRWSAEPDLTARVSAAKSELEDLYLFSNVAFIPLDARAIQQRAQSLNTGLARDFVFQNLVSFPDIDGVAESHLGFISASDLMNILQGDDGGLLSTAFYDNVRDYQGAANSVNAEIAETLSSTRRSHFALMNNGVTVIARSVRRTGNRFSIQGFQVVNGCQTCNVLWANRTQLDPTVLVPLRLISTVDEDTIIDIIRATNRQTEVREEQFFATSDYMKQLESYFESSNEDRRLYLERRLRQYALKPIEATRVVPFNSLIRAFASLVLEEPQRATKNYREVLDRIPTDILNPSHKPSVYYAAASSLYRLDFLFRNRILDRRFSSAKYHLLLASRLVVDPRPVPSLNSRDAENWAQTLVDCYWDTQRAQAVFEKAATDIETLADGDLSRDAIRTLPFTEKVLKHYGLKNWRRTRTN